MEDDLDGYNGKTVNTRTIEGLSVAQKAEQIDILLNLIKNKLQFQIQAKIFNYLPWLLKLVLALLLQIFLEFRYM